MLTSTSTNSRLTTWPATKLAALALGGSVYFALVVMVLHFLRPDVNSISQPASRYAVGPFGFLMSTAFFGLGLSGWALVVALVRGVPATARSRVGLGFIGVWATCMWVAMLFDMDVDASAPTLTGTIHDFSAFIGFFSWCAGVWLVSRRLTAAAGWRPVRAPLLVLAALMPAGYLATGLSYANGWQFFGLVQRAFLGIVLIWIVLTANQLRASAGVARPGR